ncbi:hypothetical protein ACFX13_022125 [Malus domestica]
MRCRFMLDGWCSVVSGCNFGFWLLVIVMKSLCYAKILAKERVSLKPYSDCGFANEIHNVQLRVSDITLEL